MAFFNASVLEILLGIAFIFSTALTLFIVTLPSAYDPARRDELSEKDFSDNDRKDPERSGYAYYQKHKSTEGIIKTSQSVNVVVLGDIGRSPRMQYHALSIASCGAKVNLIGYVESEVHPDIQASRLITICAIRPYPKLLQTTSKALFLLVAPLKVLWQIWSLYHALGYRTTPAKWMLVQNPPSIPTLAVAQFACFFRHTRLVIDWHNFGYSILALRLGAAHPLVRISEWYEGFFSQGATAHFAVTDAMCQVLKQKWNITAQALHDRPPKHFQPLSAEQRSDFLHRLPETAQYASDIINGQTRLIVSSTSWTPDEDFSLLLEALKSYSATATSSLQSQNKSLPKILAIITGKGPQKSHYLSLIHKMNQQNLLQSVIVTTAWLSTTDYALLLGAADLGISLHCSSSGVDLPMKVVDMFGTGLPVAGYCAFAAWSELVREGINGRGFSDSAQLSKILEELFGDSTGISDSDTGGALARLRQGALKECDRRWDDEWMPVAGALFGLKR